MKQNIKRSSLFLRNTSYGDRPCDARPITGTLSMGPCVFAARASSIRPRCYKQLTVVVVIDLLTALTRDRPP